MSTIEIKPRLGITRARRVVLTIGYTFCHFLATLVIVAFCRDLVPKYFKFFDTNDILLPAQTFAFYKIAITVNQNQTLIFIGCLFLNSSVTYGLLSLPERFRWLAMWWVTGYLLFALLFLYFGCVAIGNPIFDWNIDVPAGK